MKYESRGTVSVTNGSRVVSGSGTAWLISYDGVALNIDGLTYPIESIDSPTSLTLVAPWPHASASAVEYVLIPLQPTNYSLTSDVRDMIDLSAELNQAAQEIIETSRGPEGRPGPAGPIGPAGKNGDSGFGAIVNFNEYIGAPAGASGVNLIVPVAEGEPGITLTQSAQVVLPYNTPDAGAGIWIRATTSGWAITLGLANAPAPQPEVPQEPIDVSSEGIVYGNPGTIFPLGIYLPTGGPTTYTLTVPAGLPLRVERKSESVTKVASQWVTGATGAPYPISGNAIGDDVVLNLVKVGNAQTAFRNGHIVLNRNTYLLSPPLALDFKQTADEAITQTPPSIRVSFKGVVPQYAEAIMATLYLYGVGQMTFRPHWDGASLRIDLGRGPSSEGILSDANPAFKPGTLQTYEAEWVDNVGGEGGTLTFFVDGVQLGASKPTSVKPRITPAMTLEVNGSSGNTVQSIDNLEIEYVGVSYGKPGITSTYEAVNSGPISRADLQALVVDAREVASPQAERVVSYAASGSPTSNLAIVIGEMEMPVGRAYKVVLEDWSTGIGVPHPNELVMTRAVAQNCRFEDDTLYGKQPAWAEVLPQGPVPSIGGINYYCEGIRMGSYVQFQFGYDWNATEMPSNPFGDPSGKESYMVPHKWMIYDKAGTLLARIEQPNGEPLNTASSPAVWEGTYDSRGVAMTTRENRWYPKGTVRCGIIWRSHNPVEYTQAEIHAQVPTFEAAVPFGSQTDFSVNGLDLRIFGGGQINGFGNYRFMPWETTTYVDSQSEPAKTLSPWKNGYNATSFTTNSALWLKYTPFNMQGRSPVMALGGTRDDRQLMAEPVAIYARNKDAVRPHDGRPMKEIALDYLTGYVSDAYHCFENGRLTPLFKGNARRNITSRNHYYGAGEGSTPANQAYYQQGGRTYEWASGYSPLRVAVPYGGKSSSRPIFGTHMFDDSHAHQLPHWGSMLWKSPEFAMMGAKYMDQVRLYTEWIIDNRFGYAYEIAERGAAWKFLHAALAWKTASANSTRLYSRAEVLDWVVWDFEGFYDKHYASTPGYLNPPTNLTGGDENAATYAAANFFGPCKSDGTGGVYQHDFFIGYWLSALHAAEKIGFNAALRAASPKAKAVLDWLLVIHQKHITGRVTQGMTLNAMGYNDYETPLWTDAQISAANGIVANLPKTFGELVAAQGANAAPSWDKWTYHTGEVLSRDGQATDQILAGPSLLRDMGRTDPKLAEAETIALGLRQQKIDEEMARGADGAGSQWFKFHQTTNNPPFKPS